MVHRIWCRSLASIELVLRPFNLGPRTWNTNPCRNMKDHCPSCTLMAQTITPVLHMSISRYSGTSVSSRMMPTVFWSLSILRLWWHCRGHSMLHARFVSMVGVRWRTRDFVAAPQTDVESTLWCLARRDPRLHVCRCELRHHWADGFTQGYRKPQLVNCTSVRWSTGRDQIRANLRLSQSRLDVRFHADFLLINSWFKSFPYGRFTTCISTSPAVHRTLWDLQWSTFTLHAWSYLYGYFLG